MEYHYYRREWIKRTSENVPEAVRNIENELVDGKSLYVSNEEDLPNVIAEIIKAGIADHYKVSDISIIFCKENKRRRKRQMVHMFEAFH